MQKIIKPTELLKAIRIREDVSGQRLLSLFKALPKVSAIRLPRGFDDSEDLSVLLLALTDAERTELGLSETAKPSPPPRHLLVLPPITKFRVHAILCANDDGTGEHPIQRGGCQLPHTLIDTTNVIYQSVGIQFVYDPITISRRVNSSLLNLDFTVPAGLNYNLPESQPPLTDAQIQELAKPHEDERQRVGREHCNKLVLFVLRREYAGLRQRPGIWTLIYRTYAFSGDQAEFVPCRQARETCRVCQPSSP